jgi:hypothetical protein
MPAAKSARLTLPRILSLAGSAGAGLAMSIKGFDLPKL